ncbi:DUF2190 family protein [Azospirillum argentinense]|uniref:RecA/RadA family phage recombinase n=1 Tax=Azospirillum argentinense TaxID=2970906 RepID=A0A5B0KNH4_9PROT|nr:DUF2190 family protein [Azospirillum argentinense]KAA1052958.1 hypothetical protein FH063_003365 [Azospirillum argentinense]
MKNFIQSGNLIEVTAPAGGVTSGDGTVIGSLFGIAGSSAVEGTSVTIATKGVFELPKLSTAILATGGKVSWDADNSRCDAPGTGKYPIGVAVEAAGNGTSTVKVRLDGTATAAAS